MICLYSNPHVLFLFMKITQTLSYIPHNHYTSLGFGWVYRAIDSVGSTP